MSNYYFFLVYTISILLIKVTYVLMQTNSYMSNLFSQGYMERMYLNYKFTMFKCFLEAIHANYKPAIVTYQATPGTSAFLLKVKF